MAIDTLRYRNSRNHKSMSFIFISSSISKLLSLRFKIKNRILEKSFLYRKIVRIKKVKIVIAYTVFFLLRLEYIFFIVQIATLKCQNDYQSNQYILTTTSYILKGSTPSFINKKQNKCR